MKREFFGVDVTEALDRASGRLGIPVDQLRYETLSQDFHLPTGGERVAILVEFDETATAVAPAEDDPSYDEVMALREDPVKMGALALERIMQKMGFDCQVEASTEDTDVLLSLKFSGEKPDFRRGEIRELRGALQYLINRVAGGSRDHKYRYIIDFKGNIEERRALMASMAKSLSDRVQRLGKGVHIQLMDSQDRRLLHLALVDHDEVQTASDGEGRFRVLSISPKRDEKKKDPAPAESPEGTPSA